jgi:CHAD domain-containing protein
MRRLRAALRAFRELLPRKKRRRISRTLRKLSPVLGAARDWDVLLARTSVGPGKRLRARAARRDALHAIRSRKFARLVERAKALQVQETDEPLTEYAARALERAHRKLVRQARGVDWSDPPARHAVRIRVKRLRYTVEFFAGAFTASASYVEALKELQAVLGELNDLAVARRLVGAEGDETLLLNRLSAAWRRFSARPRFWRAGG